MRFNLKRIVIAVLCLVTVAGTLCVYNTAPVDVEAATISEYQQYIKDLEAEQKEIQKEIDRLKDDKSDQKSVQTALQNR